MSNWIERGAGTVPVGWKEDKACYFSFNVSTASTSVEHQITTMKTASKYIIKEIQVAFASVANLGTTPYFGMRSISKSDPSYSASVHDFIKKGYNVASFVIMDGNRHGAIDDYLTTKPYVFAHVGAGGSPQDIEVFVAYYYK